MQGLHSSKTDGFQYLFNEGRYLSPTHQAYTPLDSARSKRVSLKVGTIVTVIKIETTFMIITVSA